MTSLIILLSIISFLFAGFFILTKDKFIYYKENRNMLSAVLYSVGMGMSFLIFVITPYILLFVHQ